MPKRKTPTGHKLMFLCFYVNMLNVQSKSRPFKCCLSALVPMVSWALSIVRGAGAVPYSLLARTATKQGFKLGVRH